MRNHSGPKMAFDPDADFAERFQIQLTKEQRKKLGEISDWAGTSASALLRRMIEERWAEGAAAAGIDVSTRKGSEVRRPPGNPGITGAGRPHQMDAPGVPVCGCGLPSTHESGWCGRCDVTDSVIQRTGT
jgi:hypothetical protein